MIDGNTFKTLNRLRVNTTINKKGNPINKQTL